MTFTIEDVARLNIARNEIVSLKHFVAHRAETYVHMTTGVVISFENERGYSFEVKDYELFDPKAEFLNVEYRDNQYDSCRKYRIPYSFIFGEKTEEELEFEQYLILKEKFHKE
jgi:hypothetical protein